MSPRLLIVQHEDDCPPGWFGEWLEERNIELEVVAGHRGHCVPSSASGFDGLMVLGGEMGAYDDLSCGWLAPTRRLIALAVHERVPFLGICLGHQLAAVALGGVVAKNPAGQASGLTAVGLTAAGRTDELLGAVGSGALAVQWNEDIVVSLPSGATVLGHCPDSSVQAARFGSRSWGVQFHPEVSPDIFDSWTVTPRKAGGPGAVDALAAAAAVRGAEAELRSSWRPLADRFAAIITSSRPKESASAKRAVEISQGSAGRVVDR